MNTRKLSVALAALLLGVQFGSPLSAAVTEEELALVEAYVLNGQVEELVALLAANPELLQIPGVLGDALRAFMVEPTLATLQAVALLADGQIAVSLLSAVDQGLVTSNDRFEEDSIY